MTPEELDALRELVDAVGTPSAYETSQAQVDLVASVPTLIAALREAWDERNRQRVEAVQYRDRAWKAETERDWMRGGGACDTCQERERNAVIRAEKVKAEWDKALAALDRVRALCGQMNFIDATLVLAVIEGES